MGTVPPELTETPKAPSTAAEQDRVVATVRDPGLIEAAARRSPADVFIARTPGGTLPLQERRPAPDARNPEETLVSPPDPLAARQAAHTRAHDAARTLLSGLSTDAPILRRRPEWTPPAQQLAPPGGTLLSPPAGGGAMPAPPHPRVSYAAIPHAPAPAAPARGPSTAAFVAVAVLAVVVLGASAFAGTYYGARSHGSAAPVEPSAWPPPPMPTPTPTTSTAVPPLPPAPPPETAAPMPPLVKPHATLAPAPTPLPTPTPPPKRKPSATVPPPVSKPADPFGGF